MTYYKWILVTCIGMSFYSYYTIQSHKTVDTVSEYKTVVDEHNTTNKTIINGKQKYQISTNTIIDHSIWDRLLQKYVSNEGRVNYEGFQIDETKFDSYLNLLSKTSPKEFWSRNETLSFWINVYNAYTVKLILNNYPIQSIKDISKPWNKRFIKIDDKWYTLNDIEHRIIRKMDEPKIHFALVCAALSCPKLHNRAFTAKNLESNLNQLTREFLNDGSKNRLDKNTIEISKLFKWYGSDFKTNNKRLIDFINQYSDVQISSKAKTTYMDYDWRLNE